MAREGNQQKNELDGSTSNHKKGGLQSGYAMPNRKGRTLGDTQPSIYVPEALHQSDHMKDEKKRTNKSAKPIKVEIQGTTGASAVEKGELANGSHGSNNRKSSSDHSLNGFHRDGLHESVNLSETLGVGYLKTFVLSVSRFLTEWLDRHKPLIHIIVTKILISCDYVRMKIKHVCPIILRWLMRFTTILIILSMGWLVCTLRGLGSVTRMGTTLFCTVIWCSVFSVVAMIGMLKFVAVGVVVSLLAFIVEFNVGHSLLAVFGMAFKFSHERIAMLIMTLYSAYCAWTLVGWLGIILALNLSFFSSGVLLDDQRFNSILEQTTGMQSGPRVFDARASSTHGGTNRPANRSHVVPSTSGPVCEPTSEDEVDRLLNSADHYAAFGFSRFQEIDASFLKREYKKKVMLVHPDKNMGNEKAAEAFKKLQNAYEVLLDATKRKAYDNKLRREDRPKFFRRSRNV